MFGLPDGVAACLFDMDGVVTKTAIVHAVRRAHDIPVADKKLQWIDGTTARFDGYLEFQRRPDPMLEWLDAHMA